MFALSGIVIVVGLVIHYSRTPRESGPKPNRPRSTLSGVIRLLCIVIGLAVAYALWDAFVVSMMSTGSGREFYPLRVP